MASLPVALPRPIAPPLELPAGMIALTLDAALGRAQAAVDVVRRTDRVVAADGRPYKTARTTDIVRVGRAALLAQGLVLTQVRQRVRAVGRVPCLVVLYLLRYTLGKTAEVETIETEFPFPSDAGQDLHFRAGAASTYALRYTIKRLLLLEEEDDDRDVLQPSIPASDPDPWGLTPDRPMMPEERAETEARLRSARANDPAPALPDNVDELVTAGAKEARKRQFVQRAIRRKEQQSGPGSAPEVPAEFEER